MRHPLAAVLLAPLLYLQGTVVRRRTPRLPEPPGPRHGTRGQGPPLRLLIAGDSAAAGVGAPSQDEALSGQLARRLAERYRVTWQLVARTGDRTADTLERLQRMPAERFDVLVTSLGVNDVTGGTPPNTWLGDQRRLLEVARDRFGVRLSVVAGIPPMEAFPALPQPLRWYLGGRARRLTALLEEELRDDPSAHFLSLRFTLDASAMASDGFHPGPDIYRGWADRVAGILEQEVG